MAYYIQVLLIVHTMSKFANAVIHVENSNLVLCIGFASFSYQVLCRFKDEELVGITRCKRCLAFTIAVSSTLHFCLAVHRVPSFFVRQCSLPDVAFQYTGDLLLQPLMLASLGFLAGVPAAELMCAITTSWIATVGLLGTTLKLAPNSTWICFAISVVALSILFCRLNSWQDYAGKINDDNLSRVVVTTDVLMISTCCYALIHALVLSDALSASADIRSMGIADVISKVAMAHLITRSRFNLEAAALHALTKPDGDEPDEEPGNEQPN